MRLSACRDLPAPKFVSPSCRSWPICCAEPVGLGLIASLSRPGGNLAGISALTIVLGAKSVEVLKDLLPKATAMAYLVNRSNPDAEAKAKDARAGGTLRRMRRLPSRQDHGRSARAGRA
jgi:hypothetical protein